MKSRIFSSLTISFLTLGAATTTSQNLRGNQDGNEDASHVPNMRRLELDGVMHSDSIATFMFATRRHKIKGLCWPGNTQADALTKYKGRVCEDGYTIIWDSMKTVTNLESEEPIMGPDGRLCEWSRSTEDKAWNAESLTEDEAWNAEWLGSGCGHAPHSMALPRNIDEKSVARYWDIRSHRDADLCWGGDPKNSSIVKYQAMACPDDRSKLIWNSMMTIDTKTGKAMICPNGLEAVWSRHDYDPEKDAQFIKEYFGSCGVAPTKFPNLRAKLTSHNFDKIWLLVISVPIIIWMWGKVAPLEVRGGYESL